MATRALSYRHPGRSRRRGVSLLKILLGLVGGGFTLLLLVGVVMTAGGIALEVSTVAPSEVKVGEEFEIAVTVSNPDDEPHTLVAVDIWDAYLEHIDVLRSEPAWSEVFHVPLDNTESHVLNLAVPPGEQRTVTFTAVATRAGSYSSNYDVCVDSDTRFETFPISTRATE